MRKFSFGMDQIASKNPWLTRDETEIIKPRGRTIRKSMLMLWPRPYHIVFIWKAWWKDGCSGGEAMRISRSASAYNKLGTRLPRDWMTRYCSEQISQKTHFVLTSNVFKKENQRFCLDEQSKAISLAIFTEFTCSPVHLIKPEQRADPKSICIRKHTHTEHKKFKRKDFGNLLFLGSMNHMTEVWVGKWECSFNRGGVRVKIGIREPGCLWHTQTVFAVFEAVPHRDQNDASIVTKQWPLSPKSLVHPHKHKLHLSYEASREKTVHLNINGRSQTKTVCCSTPNAQLVLFHIGVPAPPEFSAISRKATDDSPFQWVSFLMTVFSRVHILQSWKKAGNFVIMDKSKILDKMVGRNSCRTKTAAPAWKPVCVPSLARLCRIKRSWITTGNRISGGCERFRTCQNTPPAHFRKRSHTRPPKTSKSERTKKDVFWKS